MIEFILILVALAGSLLSGVIDLKTTEIPDQIPYAMMVLGIIGNAVISVLAGSYWPLLSSFFVGLIFLGIGFLFYYFGQWGGGDAKLLSGIGFLLPQLPIQYSAKLLFPFPLTFFFNLFLVGAVYMIVYALVLSFMNKKIWSVFFYDIKANAKMLLVLNVIITTGLLLFGSIVLRNFIIMSFVQMIRFEITIVLAIFGMFLIWRFTKTVEDVGFKKRISTSELREGDVLLDSKVWEGLTLEQIKKVKASKKKHVWIKEGVRFGLAFPLALLFTLFIGDGIMLLLSLV